MDESDYIAIKKSTQCGVSEYLVVKAMAKASSGRSVFYVLPTFDIKNRFVQNRFDRSVQYSPYYQSLFKLAGTTKSAESMSLKHIGSGVISFAGSNTPAPFTEFPADDYIVDEKDRCDQTNLAMGEERLSHSDHKQELYVSNPTFPNVGIDLDFKTTDMKMWMIPCSNCGKWFHPDFFKDVVVQVDDSRWMVRDTEWERGMERDIMPLCPHCSKPYHRFEDGEWVAQRQSFRSGYQVSKMFSSNNSIVELVDRFDRGLANDGIMERFYNGDLGLTFESAGSKIVQSFLDSCVREYGLQDSSTEATIMGIDVGKVMHVSIGRITAEGRVRIIYLNEVREEQEIFDLYKRFNVKIGVIDAMPETRMSRRICANLYGMFMCYYGGEKRDIIDPKNKIITIDRTVALDAVKEGITLENIELPMNAGSIDNFYDQMMASVRVLDKNKDRYNWIEGEQPDHYFHSMSYLMIAKRLVVSMRG